MKTVTQEKKKMLEPGYYEVDWANLSAEDTFTAMTLLLQLFPIRIRGSQTPYEYKKFFKAVADAKGNPVKKYRA